VYQRRGSVDGFGKGLFSSTRERRNVPVTCDAKEEPSVRR
jgi:hypothetical protein